MIFWILLGIVTVIVVLLIIAGIVEGDFEDIGLAIFVTIFGGAMVMMITLFSLIGIFWGSMSSVQKDSTYALQNLGDNTSVTGRIHGGLFATYGYIDGERTINFVQKHDGYAELGSVSADQARVHEGSDNPRVVRHDYTWSNKWIVPWDLSHGTDYDFYVPAGTISSQFAIGNGGTNG